MEDTCFIYQKEWDLKVLAPIDIPIAKGIKKRHEVLMDILNAIKKNESFDERFIIEGSDSKKTLHELCIIIRPFKLVTGNGKTKPWQLTSQSESLLKNDSSYIAIYFHNHLQFFFEIIDLMKDEKEKNVMDLLEIANSNYDFGWKEYNIRERLKWLDSFSLVEKKGNNWKITKTGLEILKTDIIIQPKIEKKDMDETINKEFPGFTSEIKKIVSLENSNRKESKIYYIRNVSEILETIKEYLAYLKSNKTKQEIDYFAMSKFSIKPSTTSHFINFLQTLNLIEKTGTNNRYTSELGHKFLLEGHLLDLVLIINYNYNFFFEILEELEDSKKSEEELIQIAREKYNLDFNKDGKLKDRLRFLSTSKLILSIGKFYYLTSWGAKVINQIHIKSFSRDKGSHKNKNDISFNHFVNKDKIENICIELLHSSKDSSSSSRFEKAISEAFNFMGFNTKLIGGSGDTDVTITIPTASEHSFKVNIDAKSTTKTYVTDNLIDFDTLSEHKIKQEADYILIIGPDFKEDSRVISRAVKNNVGVMNVETLIELIKMHCKAPLEYKEYKGIFNQKGMIKLDLLKTNQDSMKKSAKLMQKIIECLFNENSNKVNRGKMTAENIYYSIKMSFDNELNISEIEGMLDFLSSPVINCLGKKGKFYSANGSISDVKNKFHFYIHNLTS